MVQRSTPVQSHARFIGMYSSRFDLLSQVSSVLTVFSRCADVEGGYSTVIRRGRRVAGRPFSKFLWAVRLPKKKTHLESLRVAGHARTALELSIYIILYLNNPQGTHCAGSRGLSTVATVRGNLTSIPWRSASASFRGELEDRRIRNDDRSRLPRRPSAARTRRRREMARAFGSQ